MRVLVTGAAGHIGRYVLDELASQGHSTRVLVAGAQDLLDHGDRVVAHCEDPDAAYRASTDVDAVIHLAAIPGPADHPAWEVFGNNTLATFVLLEQAAAAGVRQILFASSISILGMAWAPRPFSPDYVPIDERHPLYIQDPYALSKQVNELTAQALCRRYDDLTLLVYRLPFVATGAMLRDRSELQTRRPIDGAAELWGYIDARDAAEAFRRGLEVQREGVTVMNVLAPNILPCLETKALLDEFHPTAWQTREPIGRETPYDLSQMRSVLGFEPYRSAQNV